MFGLSEDVKPAMPSMKTAPDLGFEKWWLPGMDSNHELDKILNSRNLLILQSR